MRSPSKEHIRLEFRFMSYQLDELQKDGANTIIFQVRPECDALYESSIEPWSRFLSGHQGSEKEAETVVSSILNS